MRCTPPPSPTFGVPLRGVPRRASPLDCAPMRRWLLVTAVLALVARVAWVATEHRGIELPPGFEIETYASGVGNARQMALAPDGTLFVGSRSAGNVYAIPDRDK